jgi:hypothetical protein
MEAAAYRADLAHDPKSIPSGLARGGYQFSGWIMVQQEDKATNMTRRSWIILRRMRSRL